MAAYRYWRAVAFESYGVDGLEISALHLLAGSVRVDAPATLTASVAPDVSGVVANLQDDDLTTAARWSAQAVKGLALQWDFGASPVEVTNIQMAGDSEVRFPLIVSVQGSNNATSWTPIETLSPSGVRLIAFSGCSWPGARLKTVSVSSLAIRIRINHDGLDGGTTWTDTEGAVVTNNGSVTTSTVQKKNGSASSKFNGSSGSYLSVPISRLNGNFGIYTSFYWDGASGNCAIFSLRGALDLEVYLRSGSSYALSLYRGANLILGGSPAIPVTNTWNLAALERVGDIWTLTLNGNVVGTTLLSASTASLGDLLIGGYGTGSELFSGYIDDTLVVDGGTIFGGAAFSAPSNIFDAAAGGGVLIKRNTVGGASSAIRPLSQGTGPVITYGTPKISNPECLGIESGSVKDQITGVLGEGIGRVKGTVTTKGSPNQAVHRKVRLIRERDGLVIREAWSNAGTGEYDFQYVDEAQTYTVVSYDHLHNYRAVIADNLTPELMP